MKTQACYRITWKSFYKRNEEKMTIEEKYELSCYEVISKLQDNKEVYLVKHVEDDTLCVKKTLSVYSKAIYLRLKELNIPNVPQIFACVEEDNQLIIIEEYIHGKPLQKLFEQKGIFDEKELIRIMSGLCDILEVLHQSNPPIVHRDIKPSNVMMSNDGVVKLIDFNAAKTHVSGQVQDTMLMGTQEFAAPEQYGFGQSDQRTDIYALGVTMNYLLTGLFPKEKLYSGVLGAVIKLCTELDANNRYHNVSELKADLGRALERIDGRVTKQQTDTVQEKGKAANSLNTINKESAESKYKEILTKKKNIFNRSLYARKKWLPVGFRTGVIWKMILAVLGYYLFFMSGLEMESTMDGVPDSDFLTWAGRIMAWLIYLTPVYLFGNYGDVRYKLPGMNGKKIVHWLLAVVYIIVIWFAIVLLEILVVNIVI